MKEKFTDFLTKCDVKEDVPEWMQKLQASTSPEADLAKAVLNAEPVEELPVEEPVGDENDAVFLGNLQKDLRMNADQEYALRQGLQALRGDHSPEAEQKKMSLRDRLEQIQDFYRAHQNIYDRATAQK